MKPCIAALILASLGFGQTSGNTVLSGEITDSTTHKPIDGAKVACGYYPP